MQLGQVRLIVLFLSTVSLLMSCLLVHEILRGITRAGVLNSPNYNLICLIFVCSSISFLFIYFEALHMHKCLEL